MVYRTNAQDSLGQYVGGVLPANGTSFAAPAVAGMAACLWQALPNFSAMELRELIMQSASLYPLHDPQAGYGVPDAWFAYSGERTALTPTTQDLPENGKRIENGQLIIIKNGIKYTLLGLIIEKNDEK